MQRYRILHRTYYTFSGQVQLGPHVLRLRPREDHEVRIESETLTITPNATLRWHRDVEDNSVAIASFDTPASQLTIESDVVIQQFNAAPLDFLVDPQAVDYPFAYAAEDHPVLLPYMDGNRRADADPVRALVDSIWGPGEQIHWSFPENPTHACLQAAHGGSVPLRHLFRALGGARPTELCYGLFNVKLSLNTRATGRS
jgi:transglutaminase-like putative cysteine protease